MAVEETFYSTVTGDSGVSALISTRLYPMALPGTVTLPAAAYRTISRVLENSKCYQTRIQLDLYAASYSGVKALRDAAKTLVDATAGWEWREGPDAWEEAGSGRYHQPADIIIHE